MRVCHSDENYPRWVCRECGVKASRNVNNILQVSTYHTGICGVCGKEKDVTEPRDFLYPDFYIKDL